MKKKAVICLLSLIFICNVTACSRMNADNSTNQIFDSNIEDTDSESVVLPKEDSMNLDNYTEVEQDMIEKSLLAPGNNNRVKKVIEKARAGEDVTIAFIGGSITQGYNAGTSEIYAKLTYDFISQNYGTGENVHYINAGLSGTPSILGLIRAQRDIFDQEPDLIFIEFAVNDGGTQIDQTGFESLVRKSLLQENDPAVILLFSVIETGYTCQNAMNLIGFNYDLPRISMKDAIWEHIENGDFTWKDWSNDESHPNEWGQYMYAQFIIHYLQEADAAPLDEPADIPDKMVKGFDHTGIIMIDRSMNTDAVSMSSTGSFEDLGDLESFNEGWTHKASAGDNLPFTFSFTGQALYLVYKDTKTDSYGNAEVYIDGEYLMTLEANSSDGWGNPVTELIFREKTASTHTVEIRMKEDSLDLTFSILALGLVP